MPPVGFAPDEIDRPLEALDRLPRSLWLPGIVNSVGRLEERLAGLDRLQAALAAGGLPEPWLWPTGPVLAPFAAALAELNLPGYCAGRADLAEQVVKSLLWHTDAIIDDAREPDEPAAIDRAQARFRADWAERTGEIDELVWVLGDLGDLAKSERWDLLPGLLKSEGWQEVLRIRRLLEQLPELRALIARLGRAVPSDRLDPALRPVTVVEEHTVRVLEPLPLRVPDLPGETRGVRRSGSVARMLPSEAVLLRHPALRLVWFARRMEHILMCYAEQDLLEQPLPKEQHQPRPTEALRHEPRLEMGPLIVCVDTSGSMAGACEHVAKACVLEALRTAHAQGRSCYVYAFGGPGEIVEREMRLDAPGVAQAIDFLGQAFHGGTEVSEPLERAADRVREAEWRSADLLLATDGEFGATPQAAAKVQRAREEQGLRVQGVLIGDRETIGMLEVCDDIHWVRDWRRFGAGGESPVPTKSLTALYFPNALRRPT